MSEHFLLGLMTVLIGVMAAGIWVGVWQIHREVREISLTTKVTLDAAVELLRRTRG
jgi:hypothetical protein